MLYFIFTVDGDWKQYFDVNLSEDRRLPHPDTLLDLIQCEIDLAQHSLDGKFIHFIHTSPRVRTFFLEEPFMSLWKKIISNKGDIGLHCHEEDPYKEYYFQDTAKMDRIIGECLSYLREDGLDVIAYRGGFLAFCAELIPILERNCLQFDFSCEPQRFLVHNQTVVSDWRGAPASFYRMSYRDHRRPGSSNIFEIPIGSYQEQYLYFEKSSAQMLEVIASSLKEKSNKENKDIVVSALTHTYEYSKDKDIKSIKDKISVLKEYGKFINLKELQDIIEGSHLKG